MSDSDAAPAPPGLRNPLAQAQQRMAYWQGLAQAAALELRPAPPVPQTCCGRGCNGCVWEGYFDAVLFWLEDAEAVLRGHAGA